ncbi:MAG: DNA polymerase III subunit [Verrucomicrobia bacterium]|nr:DNA polymerase III subunit [Verrucomicrobiota bacterium]
MAFSAHEALEYLVNAYRHQRLPHSFLFSGEEGSGKRQLTAGFFEAINQQKFDPHHPDYHQVEPESKSRRILVDQIRSLENALRMKAARVPWKFGLISDADRLMPQAANAFLKTLEEPPANSVLILATALPDALLETIRSRCVHVSLRRLKPPELDPEAAAVLDRVARYCAGAELSVAGSLRLARSFEESLNRLRGRIEAEHEEDLKRQLEVYQKTTDGSWVENEEARLSVLTESRYVNARAKLLFRLIELFGDALRAVFTGTGASLPEYQECTRRMSERWCAGDLLERMRGLEQLQDHLGRNVQEALAIEAGFLRAFGPLPAVNPIKSGVS